MPRFSKSFSLGRLALLIPVMVWVGPFACSNGDNSTSKPASQTLAPTQSEESKLATSIRTQRATLVEAFKLYSIQIDDLSTQSDREITADKGILELTANQQLDVIHQLYKDGLIWSDRALTRIIIGKANGPLYLDQRITVGSTATKEDIQKHLNSQPRTEQFWATLGMIASDIASLEKKIPGVHVVYHSPDFTYDMTQSVMLTLDSLNHYFYFIERQKKSRAYTKIELLPEKTAFKKGVTLNKGILLGLGVFSEDGLGRFISQLPSKEDFESTVEEAKKAVNDIEKTMKIRVELSDRIAHAELAEKVTPFLKRFISWELNSQLPRELRLKRMVIAHFPDSKTLEFSPQDAGLLEISISHLEKPQEVLILLNEQKRK